MSVESVRCCGASLKAGGYRSAQLYFQAATGHQLRHLGVPLDPLLKGPIKEVVRSIRRGLGPARLKDSFDVWSLARPTWSDDEDSFSLDTVEHCLDMVVIGVWWMLREVEMSAAQVQHLHVENSMAHLLVPVHKTESCGNLMTRSLACACSNSPSRLCPWHAVERHLVRVYNHQCYRPQAYFPLFPDSDGKAPTKQRLVGAIHSVIAQTGIAMQRPDEKGVWRPRFGGHVLRVAGAQFLSSAGVCQQHVQLLGRWSSMAVERYIQFAPLSIIPGVPAQVLNPAPDREVSPRALAHGALRGPVASGLPSPRELPGEGEHEEARGWQQAFDSTADRLHRVEESVAALQQAVVLPARSYVVRSRSKMVHLAQFDEMANHPSDWKSMLWRCQLLQDQPFGP